MLNVKNIFDNLPDFPHSEEIFDKIADTDNCRIERIVSTGQSSPEDFWYNQSENEFVLLLSGSAVLEFEDYEIRLTKGDYMVIPAGVKHRVKRTDRKEHSVWLAVFY
jgi:cupin 2 domain-containing protein